jgi:hypothetical protein
MWVKLESRLDAAKAKPGDAVRAQVSQAWVYQTCGVDGGSSIEGNVVAVTAPDSVPSNTAKTSEISLGFAANCVDGARIPLILIAVYASLDDSKNQMDLYKSMPAGLGAGASGRQSIDLNSLPSPGAGENAQLPVAKMGEVKGIRHLSLAVAKGPKGSSTLASADKRLRLEAGTRLALVPVPAAH